MGNIKSALGWNTEVPTQTAIRESKKVLVESSGSEGSSSGSEGSSSGSEGRSSSDSGGCRPVGADDGYFPQYQVVQATIESQREYDFMGNLTSDAAESIALRESQYEHDVMGNMDEESAFALAMAQSVAEERQRKMAEMVWRAESATRSYADVVSAPHVVQSDQVTITADDIDLTPRKPLNRARDDLD